MTTMQFGALGKAGAASTKKAKADLPVNLAVRLDRIELSKDTPSLIHGFIVGSNEPVTVRMMTIEEGVGVNIRKGETAEECKARLQKQYAGTGEAHRPRPAEVANPSHKTHCESGGLLMFTKCLKGEDGVYRAHWMETMERSAGAGCDKVMAHIKVEDVLGKDKKVVGTSVVADVVMPDRATVVNKDNLVPTLLSTFANTNGEEKRKPFMYVRLVEKDTGKTLLSGARAAALYQEEQVSDPDSGASYKLWNAAPAEESIKNLFNPENVTQDAMVIRAALFGLGDQDGYAEHKGVTREDLLNDLKMITDNVRSGAIQVEVIPGERIGAGPASRASIEKAAKSNPNHPVNTLYVKRNDNGYVVERRFCETFVTTKLGRDGHRFFTKAVPADLYPTMQSITRMATANDHKATAQAAKERAAEAMAQDVDVGDDAVFDPAALDAGLDELDSQLAQSASALDADMN